MSTLSWPRLVRWSVRGGAVMAVLWVMGLFCTVGLSFWGHAVYMQAGDMVVAYESQMALPIPLPVIRGLPPVTTGRSYARAEGRWWGLGHAYYQDTGDTRSYRRIGVAWLFGLTAAWFGFLWYLRRAEQRGAMDHVVERFWRGVFWGCPVVAGGMLAWTILSYWIVAGSGVLGILIYMRGGELSLWTDEPWGGPDGFAWESRWYATRRVFPDPTWRGPGYWEVPGWLVVIGLLVAMWGIWRWRWRVERRDSVRGFEVIRDAGDEGRD